VVNRCNVSKSKVITNNKSDNKTKMNGLYWKISMPYMFIRKFIVLSDTEKRVYDYDMLTNRYIVKDRPLLFTEKLYTATLSSLIARYTFPIFTFFDICKMESLIRDIELPKKKIMHGFMDILIE